MGFITPNKNTPSKQLRPPSPKNFNIFPKNSLTRPPPPLEKLTPHDRALPSKIKLFRPLSNRYFSKIIQLTILEGVHAMKL